MMVTTMMMMMMVTIRQCTMGEGEIYVILQIQSEYLFLNHTHIKKDDEYTLRQAFHLMTFWLLIQTHHLNNSSSEGCPSFQVTVDKFHKWNPNELCSLDD